MVRRAAVMRWKVAAYLAIGIGLLGAASYLCWRGFGASDQERAARCYRRACEKIVMWTPWHPERLSWTSNGNAARDLRQACALDPDNDAYRYMFWRVLFRSGQPHRSELDQLVGSRSKYASRALVTSVYEKLVPANFLKLSRVELQSVLSTLERAREVDPGDARPDYALAYAVCQLGDFERALQLIESGNRRPAFKALPPPFDRWVERQRPSSAYWAEAFELAGAMTDLSHWLLEPGHDPPARYVPIPKGAARSYAQELYEHREFDKVERICRAFSRMGWKVAQVRETALGMEPQWGAALLKSALEAEITYLGDTMPDTRKTRLSDLVTRIDDALKAHQAAPKRLGAGYEASLRHVGAFYPHAGFHINPTSHVERRCWALWLLSSFALVLPLIAGLAYLAVAWARASGAEGRRWRLVSLPAMLALAVIAVWMCHLFWRGWNPCVTHLERRLESYWSRCDRALIQRLDEMAGDIAPAAAGLGER